MHPEDILPLNIAPSVHCHGCRGGYTIPGFQNTPHALSMAVAWRKASVAGTHDDFGRGGKPCTGVPFRIWPDQLEAITTMLYSEMLRHGCHAGGGIPSICTDQRNPTIT